MKPMFIGLPASQLPGSHPNLMNWLLGLKTGICSLNDLCKLILNHFKV